jgi:type I restriction-modification system DNA methylase subunit
MNETIIQEFTRDHFKSQLEGIGKIETHQSDNNKIKNALKGASKSKKGGAGYPEHIIQIFNHPDLVIITECKGEISLHENNGNVDEVKYAVDGVKHYSNFLSKHYDVLSIAISGNSPSNYKVSHFFQERNSYKIENVLGNKLLDIESYSNFYTKNEKVILQDYEKLRTFAQNLNTKLHSAKIAENYRSLLLSAILVALENINFQNSYRNLIDPTQLAEYLITSFYSYLDKEVDLSKRQLEIMKTHFDFIKTDTALTTNPNVLRDIIIDVELNIKNFIDTYKFRDVLGEIYNIFLSYSNSDKGLGIVLTPPHITEFFSELAQVNKNSVVLDNCTGTGGFLISAMKYMIEDAKGDESLISKIKENNLIGVEYSSHIYSLLISNFLIHNMKTKNLLSGSCFDEKNIITIKEKKPTVGFLNPPYKGDKKNDTEELEFVYTNLDCLEVNGTCIAILPMSSAVTVSKKVMAVKDKILQNHTLEAVLSMPNELFHNSNVGVVSCIMIFTAHKPHNFDKKVYFGYYKDDGFVKRKTSGRVDFHSKWTKMKQKWVNNYINRQDEPGFSVCKTITPLSEWSAENYLETDYSTLNKNSFVDELHRYSTFLFSNRLVEEVYMKSQEEEQIELSQVEWKTFYLPEIFEITGTKTTPPDIIKFADGGEYPYVTTQATNNGVERFTDIQTESGQVITVESSVLGFCNYQHFNFAASDHVEKLKPKFENNQYILLFIVTLINRENYRFNYGRGASKTRLAELKLKLPIDSNGNLNTEFMSRYIKSCSYSHNLQFLDSL